MRRKRGQKRKGGRFEEKQRTGTRMRRGGGGFLEKRGGHASIFLQLSKYEEGRSTGGYPLRRPIFRHWGGAAVADCATAALRAPHRNGCGRDSGRAGDSRVDVIASPGKTAAGWIGGRAAGRDFSLVYGEHGRAPRGAWVPLRRVLHAESRGLGGRFCANFEVGMEKDDHERAKYPGSGEGEIRCGGEASCRGEDRLLRRRGVVERLRPDHAESLWRSGERQFAGGGGGCVAWLRESDGAGEIAGGRSGARPRLGRRH